MKKKILIISDSLGIKRKKINVTYVQLLQRYFNVYHIGLIGLTSRKALKIIKKKKLKYFDYVIMHFGIVDCCPRPFSHSLSFLLNKCFITRYIYDILSRSPKFLKFVNIQWVTEKDFKKNINELKNILLKKTKKIIYIPISTPLNFLKKNCGDFSNIVNKYNNTLKTKKNNNEIYLNVYNNRNNSYHFINDGVHLSQRGHEMIFKIIKKSLYKRN